MKGVPKCCEYLYFSNQLEFKSWARRCGLNKKNGADFYFDNVSCVDATREDQPTIPNVRADGTMTWYDALHILKAYFNITP